MGAIESFVDSIANEAEDNTPSRIGAVRKIARVLANARHLNVLERDIAIEHTAMKLHISRRHVQTAVNESYVGPTLRLVGFEVEVDWDAVEECIRLGLTESGEPANDTSAFELSPIEKSFAEAWAREGTGIHLVAQHPVGRYRIDFAHLQTMTAIELDGFATHSSTQDIENDRKRQRAIEDAGWYVRRYGGREIHRDVRACVLEVVDCIRRREARR